MIILFSSTAEMYYVRAETIKITHAQDIWISALEWCESQGNLKAINPDDKDHTPSYYSFQFKPGTFRLFGELYGIIEKGKTNEQIMELIKEHSIQREIVENMVNDKSITSNQWKYRLFPGCVKKLGLPPKY